MRSVRHVFPAPAAAPQGGGAAVPSLERAALYQAAFTAQGMKAPTLRSLVTAFGSLEAALHAPAADVAQALEITRNAAAQQVAKVLRGLPAARAQVRAALHAGLQVLTWEDAGYPPALHDDPVGCAPILFVEGVLPPHLEYTSRHVRAVAVVGTRRATPGGLSFARDMGRALSREGVLVVSGLAIGIDAAAHEGALEASDQAASGAVVQHHYQWAPGEVPTPRPAGTVAVLGGGHGHLHPAANAGLARRILAAGGAVLSEWAPDVTPLPYRFLQRNRVISGLSRGVLVIEAGVRSGTNSTVAHALEQGRDTMAVPASPWTTSGASCLNMIREGAEFVFEFSDVLARFEELAQRHPHELAAERSQFERMAAMPGAQPLFAVGGAAPDGGALPGGGAAPGRGATSGVVGSEANVDPGVTAAIRAALEPGTEVTLDALAAACPFEPSVLIGALAALELEGVVQSTPSGRFRLRDALPTRAVSELRAKRRSRK